MILVCKLLICFIATYPIFLHERVLSSGSKLIRSTTILCPGMALILHGHDREFMLVDEMYPDCWFSWICSFW